MAEAIQGFVREEVEVANLPDVAPPLAVGRKGDAVAAVGHDLRAGAEGSAPEVGVVGLEEGGGHGGGGGDDGVSATEPEVEEGAIDVGKVVEGLVWLRPELREVPHDGPAHWARWEWCREPGSEVQIEESGENESEEEEVKWSHGCLRVKFC